jgi:uncharacterized protein YdaU (DUF1376 family)
MEDLAYRRLLDLYYLREMPLPADIQATAKLVRMRSMAADVESVLREFFMLTEEGWTHARCDEEITHMQDKQAKARAAAALSVNSRLAKQQAAVQRALQELEANAERMFAKQQADVELPTPTPTPTPTPEKEKKEARKRAAPVGATRPESVAEDVWRDWTDLRKAKRAPVSPTVLAEAEREAGKAGLPLEDFLRVWCARGSQGLQADWLKPAERQINGHQPETTYARSMREKYEKVCPDIAAKRPGATPYTVDMELPHAIR